MRSASRTGGGLAVLITLTVVAAACSGENHEGHPTTSPPVTASPSTSPSTSPTSSASPTTTSNEVVIEVQVANGRVTPSPDRRVNLVQGQPVRIVVTSDVADQVHVHGYDLEAEVGAGESVTLDFVADQTGQFEVELHELDPGLLFTLRVQ